MVYIRFVSNLCHIQAGCHSVLAEAAMRGHVSMVKTLCQKYHCDPAAAVKVYIPQELHLTWCINLFGSIYMHKL